MSAAFALSQNAPAITTAPAKRPALTIVHAAEDAAAQLHAERLKKRVAVRSRMAGLVESATSMALFHAYRP